MQIFNQFFSLNFVKKLTFLNIYKKRRLENKLQSFTFALELSFSLNYNAKISNYSEKML